ncbi:hypothetical protein U5640_36275 [Streptomyces sp. SS7]|uniref:hypothetical protein n=1 Tax=Streptomyces sp. SS7 TaxID=3108485 RepID=UPI0030EDDD62
MTPYQVFIVSAVGGLAGVLGAAALAAACYGIGIVTVRAFDHLYEKRQQWRDRRAGRTARREFDRITALYDTEDPR